MFVMRALPDLVSPWSRRNFGKWAEAVAAGIEGKGMHFLGLLPMIDPPRHLVQGSPFGAASCHRHRRAT